MMKNLYSLKTQLSKDQYYSTDEFFTTIPVDEFYTRELCKSLINDIPIDKLKQLFKIVKSKGFQDSITFEVSLNL